MIELQKKLQKDEADDFDITCIKHAILILEPILTILNQKTRVSTAKQYASQNFSNTFSHIHSVQPY